MPNVLKTSFYNNPNIGLYAFATDSYCILAPNIKEELVEKIKSVLKVPIYQLTIFNSNLIGVFCSGNKDILLVPSLITEHEIKTLEKFNIPYKIIDTKLTALGNNLVIKDNICLANPNYSSKTLKQLENFKVTQDKIANLSTVGSCAVITKKGCLLHIDSTEADIKKIENLFKVKSDIGTVNMGNPYVHSGIIANSNGYIVGGQTSGPEIMRIDFALKNLEK